ncbi:hypothetical protein C8A00DRAFT_31043 [Chaetomidium leptoderma]|uniref:Aminoglycoside phosphotransferase domain-containing protein n=1 Tax=Chaetomidium leptoderma TaxID=669021 RepID=A0AAN6ZZ37_9PEZI|nr:hypothetical protein C8A00DRAFT_31043 [Chaetomidium leptoderma]
MAAQPSPSTLLAFGLSGTPRPLSGGRGLCYRIGDVVPRPCDDEAESQWLSQLSRALLRTSPVGYRLANPIPSLASPDIFVVDGWAASSFVPGRVSVAHFPDLFRAARLLHSDLADLVKQKPAAVTGRPFNRFDEADGVTWAEKSLADVDKVNKELLAQLQPILDQLSGEMRPLPEESAQLKCQLIHMDLLGNVLFEEGRAPGIIDLTFYWRPALYAEAVVVFDGLTWERDIGAKLVDMYLQDGEVGKKPREIRVQLLLRALYWRYLTFAIDPDLEFVRINLPLADHAGAAILSVAWLSDDCNQEAILRGRIVAGSRHPGNSHI